MMTRGAAMVRRQLGRHASHAVTYTDDDAVSIVVVASIGVVEVASNADEGFVVRSRMRDFLIDAAYLKTDAGDAIEPQAGFFILDRGERYQIVPIGDEPHWRWSDRDHKRYRVHTQHGGKA